VPPRGRDQLIRTWALNSGSMQAAEHELSRRRPTECGKRQNPVLPPVVGTSVQIRRRIIAATDYHPLGPGSTLSTDGAWCLAGTTGTRGLVSDPESDGAAMGYWLRSEERRVGKE